MLKEGTTEVQVRNEAPKIEEVKASGELTLYYSWLESFSGHQVVSTHLKLVPGDSGKVILDESNEDTGCIPGMLSSCASEKYEIDLDTLIKLIREYGTRL